MLLRGGIEKEKLFFATQLTNFCVTVSDRIVFMPATVSQRQMVVYMLGTKMSYDLLRL